MEPADPRGGMIIETKGFRLCAGIGRDAAWVTLVAFAAATGSAVVASFVANMSLLAVPSLLVMVARQPSTTLARAESPEPAYAY